MWRTVCVRGAGFDARIPESLRCAKAANAADALLAAEEALAAAVKEAVQRWEEELSRTEPSNQRRLARAIKDARAGAFGSALAANDSQLGAALGSFQDATAATARDFDEARLDTSRRLRSLAADAKLRRAVAWQNRALLHRAFDPLIRTPVARTDFQTRQRERLIAGYICRYCLKNESVGDFGPVGWGSIRDAGPPIEHRPGQALARDFRAHFEHWAVAAVAEALGNAPDMKPWLLPRRSPLVHSSGGAALTPFGATPLTPLQARVLAACDGTKSARRIANETADEADDPDRAYEALLELERSGLVRLAFDVGFTTDCEQGLVEDLRHIGDDHLRARSERSVQKLLAERDAAEAAQTEQELLGALERLDEGFTRLTSASSTRNAGATYGGRTLLFPGATRDVDVRFGPQFVERMRPALSLLLTSARWLSAAVAAIIAEEARTIFDGVAKAVGSPEVDLITVFPAVVSLLPAMGGGHPRLTAVTSEWCTRWSRILGLTPDVREVRRSAKELEPEVLSEFAADRPGWPSARYHSPDVLVGASSGDQLARGDFEIVLGELHLFANTIDQIAFVRAHPNPGEIHAAVAADLPQGRFAPVAGGSLLRCSALRSPNDMDIEFDEMRSALPRDHVVAAADLVVCVIEDQLAIRTRDGRRCWSLMRALDELMALFDTKLLPPAPHTPRIAIDDIIVWRESWRFLPDELPRIARDSAPFDRWVTTRRWAHARALPRRIFVKSSEEKKPFYVDLDAPILVEQFAKLAARSRHVDVTEMLPTPEQAWLTDADQRPHLSELRFVAVDNEHAPSFRWER